jgi:hypothetical protein
VPITSYELPLFDHVHDLDLPECSLRRPKQLEPQHGVYHPLNGLLILFNDVVDILDRASFNTSLVLLAYEPAIRQLISTTMVSTCSLAPASPAATVPRQPPGR